MNITKNQKILVGVGALAGLLFLSRGDDQSYAGGSGGFGSADGFDSGFAGDSAGDGNASPAGVTLNFPSPDNSVLARFIDDTPARAESEPSKPKKTLMSSPVAPATAEAAKNTVTSSLLNISPKSIKAGSTLAAIEGSNLSPEAKTDLLGYVGTPANVVDEQIKKVKAATGTNLISQKGNEFSEYTYAEKAKSKPEANIFQRMIGVVISPAVEEPRSVTAGKNIIAPVYGNIVSNKSSWSAGTVKVVPSGGSQDVTERVQASQISKKEAAGQAAVKILDSGAGKSLLPYSPSNSRKSTGSPTVVKKVAVEPAKKSWTLAEVKAGKNRR